jgi:hypothetical protein
MGHIHGRFVPGTHFIHILGHIHGNIARLPQKDFFFQKFLFLKKTKHKTFSFS